MYVCIYKSVCVCVCVWACVYVCTYTALVRHMAQLHSSDACAEGGSLVFATRMHGLGAQVIRNELKQYGINDEY